jgi:hypothetical protein
MVPSVEELPAVPFTDQETAVLLVPVTAAENVSVAPARMLAVAGVTTTAMDEFGAGAGDLVDEGPAPELQDAKENTIAKIAATRGTWPSRRKSAAAPNLACGTRIVMVVWRGRR